MTYEFSNGAGVLEASPKASRSNSATSAGSLRVVSSEPCSICAARQLLKPLKCRHCTTDPAIRSLAKNRMATGRRHCCSEGVAAAARGEGGGPSWTRCCPRCAGTTTGSTACAIPTATASSPPCSPTNPASTTRRSTTRTCGIQGTDLEDYTAAWERVAGPYADRRPRSREDVRPRPLHLRRRARQQPSTARTSACSASCCESVGDAAGASRCARRAAHTTRRPRLEVSRRGGGLFFDLAGRVRSGSA